MQRYISLPSTTPTEASQQFNELLMQVSSRGERFLVERRGRPPVLVTLEPLKLNSSELRAKADQLLDELGDALKDAGVSLDDLIESGREIRGEIVKEVYNLPTENA